MGKGRISLKIGCIVFCLSGLWSVFSAAFTEGDADKLSTRALSKIAFAATCTVSAENKKFAVGTVFERNFPARFLSVIGLHEPSLTEAKTFADSINAAYLERNLAEIRLLKTSVLPYRINAKLQSTTVFVMAGFSFEDPIEEPRVDKIVFLGLDGNVIASRKITFCP